VGQDRRSSQAFSLFSRFIAVILGGLIQLQDHPLHLWSPMIASSRPERV
jgi:hypothetical protein